MLERLGYFVTESSEHFAEYTPWFIKQHQPELIERYNIPLDEYLGRCEAQIRAWNYTEEAREHPDADHEAILRERLADIDVMPGMIDHLVHSFEKMDEVTRSQEYGSRIIHSMETGTPRVVYGNVLNEGLIDNLPQGCCVEVPCLVDKNGVQPTQIGALPPHLAALMQTNVNVQSLVVEALMTGKREYIYHAAMLDPHTAAELTIDEIWSLVDDLLEAHSEWLPEFQ
jgi:alpha-galactosidase